MTAPKVNEKAMRLLTVVNNVHAAINKEVNAEKRASKSKLDADLANIEKTHMTAFLNSEVQTFAELDRTHLSIKRDVAAAKRYSREKLDAAISRIAEEHLAAIYNFTNVVDPKVEAKSDRVTMPTAETIDGE